MSLPESILPIFFSVLDRPWRMEVESGEDYWALYFVSGFYFSSFIFFRSMNLAM
jgi:hypothetical protein